jgi:hypothetical protein
MARCPAHDDRHNSLKVSRGKDRSLVHCHAACEIDAICNAMNLSTADLFYVSRRGHSINGPANAEARPLTLKQFADAKGFKPDFLKDMGVADKKGGLVFRYLLMDGQQAVRQRIRLSLSGDKRFIWNKAEGRPVPYGLWRLKEARSLGFTDLVLVEGESDSLTLWRYDIAALGIPGADNCALLQAPHIAKFRRVFICREDDHGGEVFEKGCTGRLAQLAFDGDVAVIEMARAAVKDVNDLHLKFLGRADDIKSEWNALVLQARRIELSIVGLEMFTVDTIEEKPIRWLWPNRIPLGKLVLFVGHPGLGKSFASLDVAARLSNGQMWPDGSQNSITAKTIVFSAEDAADDTIKPRLTALGALQSNIVIVKRVREMNKAGEVVRRGFNLSCDLPYLESALNRYAEAKLVVIDPISAYMAKIDTHKNAEVRTEILDPLAELAERREVTILAITHFNKGGSGNGLERVSGSVAFPAAARVVWGFSRDPEDPSKRLMLFGKSNVGPEMPGLAFQIAEDQDGRPTLQWISGDVDENLTDVLRREQDSQRDSTSTKLDQAKKLITTLLADGPRSASEVHKLLSDVNIGDRTIWRARAELGVEISRQGYGKGSRVMVTLPASPTDFRRIS